MTDDNRDQLTGKDLLVAYYDVDYKRNPKGSNYWRNRYGSLTWGPHLQRGLVFLDDCCRQLVKKWTYTAFLAGLYF